jgi:hypothetical protein
MNKVNKQIPWVVAGLTIWLTANLAPLMASVPVNSSSTKALGEAQVLDPMPVFHYPIVEEAVISSYFDHDSRPQGIIFYDGRSSSARNGYVFTCPAINEVVPGAGNVWVGCGGDAQDEVSCANAEELWYDNHQGIDFEYDINWHTGPSCNMDQFSDLAPPVYAPAAGVVDYIGENHPFNGTFIRLYHDVNGDGNFYNDGLRSYYLHLANNGIVVDEGDIVTQGDLLGYGGMTGLAWTPHLHFQVEQQIGDNWQAVDPFDWTDVSAKVP